jgi:hypothetical protein
MGQFELAGAALLYRTERGREQPTGCESNGVKVPMPSVARFRRLAYPTCEKATTHTVLGSKRHGCHVMKSVTSVGTIWVASKTGGLNIKE